MQVAFFPYLGYINLVTNCTLASKHASATQGSPKSKRGRRSSSYKSRHTTKNVLTQFLFE